MFEKGRGTPIDGLPSTFFWFNKIVSDQIFISSICYVLMSALS